MAEIPARHLGVPRSHSTAKKLGYKKAKVKFADLSDELKASFVKFADHGARANSVCGVGPSPDPRYWLVCYKDEAGKCNWVQVPRTEVQDHE